MIICRTAAKAGNLPAGAATYDEAAKLAQEHDARSVARQLCRH
jgi:hypothetical protein